MIRNRNLIFSYVTADSDDVDKSFQLPKVATADLPTAGTANEGGLVYDATTDSVKYSDASSWNELAKNT